MGLNEIVQIGNRIRELRSKKGITQKKMSELTGIPYTTYSNYENNNRTPGIDALKKICEILGVTINELMYDPEQHRAKFIGSTDAKEPLRFTVPTSDEPPKRDYSSVKILDENRFRRILQKEERGLKLTQEERDYKAFFLDESFKRLANRFMEYYLMLNNEGRKKADKEITRTLEFLMLLSQVPEYRKPDNEE